MIANAQRGGGVAAFIDAEHALDIEYARKLGVDVDNLLVSQPDTGEQALEIAEVLVRSSAVEVVVIDSVAALVPRAEIEGEMGDSHVGLQARLMSQALRKLTGAINRSQTTVIFTNQIREKIGVMFGSPETTTGGRALKFYASLRIDIRRIGSIKDREVLVGNKTRAKIVKNKVAPPFKQADFDIMFNVGIDHYGIIVDLAVESDVINKSGAWFSFGDVRLGQGRENAKAFLQENPEVAARVEARVKEVMGMRGISATADGRQRRLRHLSRPRMHEGPFRRGERGPRLIDHAGCSRGGGLCENSGNVSGPSWYPPTRKSSGAWSRPSSAGWCCGWPCGGCGRSSSRARECSTRRTATRAQPPSRGARSSRRTSSPPTRPS